jgi:hypothetical protein
VNLKGSWSGSLVLVGNGPSLNDYDLAGCSVPTMAMNGISTLYKDTTWRPTFYVCIATAATEKGYREVLAPSVDAAKRSFLNVDTVYKNERSVFLKRDESLNWYDDILERVSVFGTSTLASMQIAAYLGFTSIYMIGFDGGYTKFIDKKPTHYFSEDYPRSSTVDYEKVNWKRLNIDHQAALSFGIRNLNARGIKVFSVERLA